MLSLPEPILFYIYTIYAYYPYRSVFCSIYIYTLHAYYPYRGVYCSLYTLYACYPYLSVYCSLYIYIYIYSPCILSIPECLLFFIYRNYPKYSDTLNVRTPSLFLKRHLFYVPYISGHVPYRVFLLSVNIRTPKTCPLFLIKLLFFTT